ncbi:undecaprenyldiphospho-muramoylpentapeptide beta-N-acetylglucosaminyltransferase [Niabella insulamsoli]|uniref:undecaprenyldiphospho-muramoylpentapeptide beta-N-acetylglucosaminyltransferase n=1 Tax=Niabella insulamsoli TaxID=3144874 RepID=UPI0031FE07A1
MHKKIIIAGGGTGGHIFPAIAIANAIKQQQPATEFLFVGAKGKMEMERVPQAGYQIVGIDIAGLNRSSLLKNIGLPLKIVKSFLQVRRIFKEFKPDAVIGVGGYATFPVLKHAQAMGVPTFIHESNSFAGKANKMLAKGAEKIFTGTPGMEQFFPAEKIMVTGNPVRSVIAEASISREDALAFFDLDPKKTTILVVGGSLGARSINEAILGGAAQLLGENLQLVWQTGKSLATEAAQLGAAHKAIWASEFISNMEYAYAAADMVIARAGAMTVAEISIVAKPAIFVPYPYAAEDHQTANAKQLADLGAALLVKDGDAKKELVEKAIALAGDATKRKAMHDQLAALGIKDAANRVAEEILKSISK